MQGPTTIGKLKGCVYAALRKFKSNNAEMVAEITDRDRFVICTGTLDPDWVKICTKNDIVGFLPADCVEITQIVGS